MSQTNYDSPTSFLQVKFFIYHVIQDQAKAVTAYTKEMKLTLTKLEKIGYEWKKRPWTASPVLAVPLYKAANV